MPALHLGVITFDPYPFEPRALRLAEAAADAGHAVDVICLRRTGQPPAEEHHRVRIYRLPMQRGVGWPLPAMVLAWFWFLLLAAGTVSWLHLKQRYDVIHVHNIPDFLVFSTLLPRLLGARIILDVQDVTPELMTAKAKGRHRKLLVRLARWQERLAKRYAHHVLTVGWPFEAVLAQRGVPQEKLSSILNSADPRLFPASRRQPSPGTLSEANPFVVMYHGTLAERTGVDVAIRALAHARQSIPRLRLAIQGASKYKPTLVRLAEDLEVADAVIFRDPGPPEHIVDFVVQGDVGIIPYRVDGFADLVLPTKAYEFAWMERPMIASRTSAIRSMFRSESIVLCDPQSPESFAQAIIDLYQHPDKCKSLVANAAIDYLPYRWEGMAKRYQQLLVSLSAPRQLVAHQCSGRGLMREKRVWRQGAARSGGLPEKAPDLTEHRRGGSNRSPFQSGRTWCRPLPRGLSRGNPPAQDHGSPEVKAHA